MSMDSTLNKYPPQRDFYKMEPEQGQSRMSTWRVILNLATIIGTVDITLRLILFALKAMLNSFLFSMFIFMFQVVANLKVWNEDLNQNQEAPQQQEKHNQTYKAAEIMYKAATGESLTDIILQAALDEDALAKRNKNIKETEKMAKKLASSLEAGNNKKVIQTIQSLVSINNEKVTKNTEKHVTKKEIKASKDSEDVLAKIPNEENHVAKENNSFNAIFKRSKERKLNDTRKKEIEKINLEELPPTLSAAPLPRLSYQDVLKEIERERLENLRKSYSINENIPEELRKSSEVITSIRQQQQTFYPDEETFTDIPEISAKNVSNPIYVPENRQRVGFIECFSEPSNEERVIPNEEDTSKITKKKSFLRRKFSKLKKGLKISRKNSFSKSGSKHK